jgi:hypothetical protein
MNISNTITSIGVLCILIAYYANTKNILPKNKLYFILNTAGALLAGIGAAMIEFWPIAFLELVWVTVSIQELYKSFLQKESSSKN